MKFLLFCRVKSHSFRFGQREFQNNILIQRNKYFYLPDLGLPYIEKIKLFFMKKTFIQKIFVVLKLSAFCFEISSFSSIPWFLSVSYSIYCSCYVNCGYYVTVLVYRCTFRILGRQGFKLCITKKGQICINSSLLLANNYW